MIRHIGIVGCRERDSDKDLQLLREELIRWLNKFDHPDDETIIVSGGCPLGGDRFAEILAEEFDLPIVIHYPDKSKLPQATLGSSMNMWDWARICKARNTLIANDSDLLIAIVSEVRKGGTEDTIKKFRNRSCGPLILL